MFKKINVLIIFILTVNIGFTQNNINDYKYVIVPDSYEFSKEPDQFKLNSLSKFLFNKYGFISIMADEALPQELINNGCLALYADVLKDASMFKTKLQIQLKNCKKEVVFLSQVGESRDKSYHVAYNVALRDAFESFKTLNYEYKPSKNGVANNQVESEATQEEIVRLQEEIKMLKREKQVEVVETPKDNNTNQTMPSESSLENSATEFKAKLMSKGLFIYNLIDSKGQVAYTIVFSGKEDVFIVKDTDAIIYKMNGKWVLAKTKTDNSLEVTVITIDF